MIPLDDRSDYEIAYAVKVLRELRNSAEDSFLFDPSLATPGQFDAICNLGAAGYIRIYEQPDGTAVIKQRRAR